MKKYMMPFILFALLLFIVLSYKEKGIYRPELISIRNKHLIGKEVILNNIEVYNKEDLSEKNTTLHSIPSNRIVRSSDDFVPVSIGIFKTKYKKEKCITPEIIFNNGTIAIFTKANGDSWCLKAGDSVIYSYKKYFNETNEKRSMGIGLIKNGNIEGSIIYNEIAGDCLIEINEDGNYYLYVANYTSENIALKEGVISFITGR